MVVASGHVIGVACLLFIIVLFICLRLDGIYNKVRDIDSIADSVGSLRNMLRDLRYENNDLKNKIQVLKAALKTTDEEYEKLEERYERLRDRALEANIIALRPIVLKKGQ